MLARIETASRALAAPVPPTGIFRTATLHALFDQPLEKVQAGATVVWEGDAARHAFLVEDGVLRIVRILGDGRRIITGFIFRGDLIGISLHRRHPYSVEAVTPARIRRLAQTRLQEEIGRRPELRPEIFGVLADEMEAAQDQMVLLARKSAEERVCSFLLLIARRTGAVVDVAPVIEIPMTRLDIADFLGLTIETVSRTITKLTARGLISPAGRHALKLCEMRRLRDIEGQDESDPEQEHQSTSRQAHWPQ